MYLCLIFYEVLIYSIDYSSVELCIFIVNLIILLSEVRCHFKQSKRHIRIFESQEFFLIPAKFYHMYYIKITDTSDYTCHFFLHIEHTNTSHKTVYIYLLSCEAILDLPRMRCLPPPLTSQYLIFISVVFIHCIVILCSFLT